MFARRDVMLILDRQYGRSTEIFDAFVQSLRPRQCNANKQLYLKCYYDQKITFIFSSDFETMFIKHSASEIISLNFEKKTVNLNCNFPF